MDGASVPTRGGGTVLSVLEGGKGRIEAHVSCLLGIKGM